MKNKFFLKDAKLSPVFYVIILLSAVFTNNCSKDVPKTYGNDNAVTTNKTVNQNVNSPNNVNSSVKKADLSSPTQTDKTRHYAVKTKDKELYLRTASKTQMERYKKEAEEEHKTLDELLKEFFEMLSGSGEAVVRNEIIKGDTATLESQITDTYWVVTTFVKENGEWKCDGGGESVAEYQKKHPDYKTIK